MPSTSMPRAATSVATSVSTSPRSKRASAFSRWDWDLSPCMATASTPWRRRRLTSRSAPRLVRTKTSVRPRSASPSSRDQRVELVLVGDARRSGARRRPRCSAGALLVAARRRACRRRRAGRPRPRAWRRRRASGGRAGVWRDDAVDRRAGSPCRACGRPRRARASARGRGGRRRGRCRSSRRPGVATMMWARRAALGLALDADAAVDGGDRQRAGARRSSRARRRSGWRARGSGASTSAARRARRRPAMRSTSGTPKASVLPEPVGDCTSTSRPASTSGTTSSWTGKGVVDAARRERVRDRFGHAEIGEGLRGHRCSSRGGRRRGREDLGDSADPDRWGVRRQEPRERRRRSPR